MRERDWFVAYVDDPDVEFNPATHIPGDLSVVSVEWQHVEGDGLVCTIEVERFPEGPLAPSRKHYAILGRRNDAGTGWLVKGKGRVGPPTSDSENETVTLKIECLPDDWQHRKRAAVQPVKDLPTFDALLLSPGSLNDPAKILEGHTAVVEFDPVTHDAVLVDFFGVGAAVVEPDPDDVYQIAYEIVDTPIAGVQINLTAEWVEIRQGTFGLGDALTDAMGGSVSTLTPDPFAKKWPKPGDKIGGAGGSGYEFVEADLVVDAEVVVGPFHGSTDLYNYVDDPNLLAPLARDVYLVRTYFAGALTVGWRRQQKRVETFSLYVPNECQPVALGTGEVKTLNIKLQSVTVDESVKPYIPGAFYSAGDRVLIFFTVFERNEDGVALAWWADQANWTAIDSHAPLGGKDKNTYFQTLRGRMSIDAAVFQARALIADSQRIVEVSFDCDPKDALFLLTPANRIVLDGIPHDILPGGFVDAKVYSVKGSSKDGDELMTVTVRAACGSGVGSTAGGNYVTQTGQAWDIIKWSDISDQVPVPLPDGGLVEIVAVNTAAEQIAYIAANDFVSGDPDRSDPEATDPANLVKDVPTDWAMRFSPLNGPPELALQIVAEPIKGFSGPRQIDLEAAA